MKLRPRLSLLPPSSSYSTPPAPPEKVFYDLKAYLESTGAAVPHQLASHAAAKAAPGTRNERGELMNKTRDKVQYAK